MIKKYHSKKYLIEQLKTKNYIQIAVANKVSPDTIQHHMNKHCLTNKRISWTLGEIELLKKEYPNSQEIYKLFPDKTKSSINHKASRLGLKRINRVRKYDINHDFFKKINKEMFYVLGIFFSDGDVSSDKKYVRIHLKKTDYEILNKINKLMGSNRPIGIYSESACLRLDSKELAIDLIKIGCIPKKSNILKFPHVNKEFLSHFIRGYFDGDGSIHFNKPNTIKVSFVGTKEFLSTMQNEIKNAINIKCNPINKVKSVWRIYYYGDDARKLCYWMYKNSKGLYLRRKKDRFDKHIMLRKNERI